MLQKCLEDDCKILEKTYISNVRKINKKFEEEANHVQDEWYKEGRNVFKGLVDIDKEDKFAELLDEDTDEEIALISKDNPKNKPFTGITRVNSKCIKRCLRLGGVFCNMPKTEFGICCETE
jgi:hypothetical protein